MKLLISVIVPAYNIEDYIGRCLDSLLCQIYNNLEIIVIDDGSSDRTGNIIDEYAKNHKNLKVVHKKNEGVSVARNTGMDIASGDYVGFVDGDDVIENNMYEVLLNNAVKYEADISHCGYKMVFPSRTDYYYNTGELVIQDNYKGIEDLILGHRVEPGVCNKLYKRSLLENIRFNPNIKITEDLLFNFYLFKKSEKSVFCDKVLYLYMIRNESAATSKININKIIDPVKVMEEIMGNIDINSNLYNLIYERYLRSLLVICRNKEIRSSKNYKLYVDKFREKLKRGYSKKENRIISSKLKYMVLVNIYTPKIFNIVDEVYSTISGNKRKYEVR